MGFNSVFKGLKHNELQNIRKKAATAQYEALSRLLPGGTEESHEDFRITDCQTEMYDLWC